ncbi:methyltransferase [Actinoplanes sp. NPDC051851]|uniref:methyltransferase n=1 Tax=Actinoplanes sp. NPDC051851 TaxID=3154753 RepID=UPI00343EFAC3
MTIDLTRLCIHDGLLIIEGEGVHPIGRDTVCLALRTDEVGAGTALVIGCGNGLLALRLARRGIRVVAVDINENAVLTCSRNAVLNHVADDLRTLHADIMCAGDIGSYDLVVTNPPQLPTGHTNPGDGRHSWISLANDGGENGRAFIEWLCEHAENLLNPGGSLMFTHFDYLNPDDTVHRLRTRGFEVAVDPGITKAVGALSGERLRRLGVELDGYRVLVILARLPPGGTYQ